MSNSLIESWWRSLKHRWLYLHPFDIFATVERLVAVYVQQHNSVIPHSAFNGQTPDEMYSGSGASVPDQLARARAAAQDARIAANRALTCEDCRPQSSPSTTLRPREQSFGISTLLHLQPIPPECL
ncbi:MAG: integrase core domain-containing protein [Polyangiaceae bacterium]|nr:integrase core domain-containing protein [Polyangiaceae bacterium]